MPKINIGDETVKVIRHGSDLVKEVYSGSDLIYRAFHNFVEGCNGNTLLPAQGNGSRLIIPEHPGDLPPGEYFHYYNFGGNKVRPGNVIIYPENPSIATLQNLGFDNQETPYYYPDHFVAYYSSSPGGEPSTDSYYRINVTGVSGVWAEGTGYSIDTETRQVNGSSTTTTNVTIPFFDAGVNGFDYDGMTFWKVGIMERPEGHYPDTIHTLGPLISSGNIVTGYTLEANGIVIREFFVVYKGSDNSYYFFT